MRRRLRAGVGGRHWAERPWDRVEQQLVEFRRIQQLEFVRRYIERGRQLEREQLVELRRLVRRVRAAVYPRGLPLLQIELSGERLLQRVLLRPIHDEVRLEAFRMLMRAAGRTIDS